MSSEKTTALVIRQADFSESSRVVTFFTKDFGKVPLLAKGAKRLKGPFESALDLLSACDIVFLRKSSGSLGILTEAHLRERFHNAGCELSRLYGGYYIAELLEGLTEEFDPHPGLYEEALHGLHRLDDVTVEPQLAIVLFEFAVLRETGHLPNFEECVVCGRAADSRAPYAFWVSQGGILCRECQKQDYRRNRLRMKSVELLQLWSQPEPIILEHVDASILKEISNVTTTAVTYNLGRPPKTLRYLKQFR
ncbi:MAG TPA: DNA repair protein RecO [Planctomycetaceae bacterium]|nr:DNA repair protein RecO [Planctomycetaceae bacterium]